MDSVPDPDTSYLYYYDVLEVSFLEILINEKFHSTVDPKQHMERKLYEEFSS